MVLRESHPRSFLSCIKILHNSQWNFCAATNNILKSLTTTESAIETKCKTVKQICLPQAGGFPWTECHIFMSLNTHYFATFRVRISYASYLRVIKRSPSINSLVSVGSIDSCRISLYSQCKQNFKRQGKNQLQCPAKVTKICNLNLRGQAK